MSVSRLGFELLERMDELAIARDEELSGWRDFAAFLANLELSDEKASKFSVALRTLNRATAEASLDSKLLAASEAVRVFMSVMPSPAERAAPLRGKRFDVPSKAL